MTRFAQVLVVLIVSATSIFGQFGAGIEYQSLNSNHWSSVMNDAEGDAEYTSILVGGSLYYWFRLKDKRIEFLPEVGYASTLSSNSSLYTKQQRVSAAFNVDIYLFDLINDCDCPTFSKQGGFFQRSFFIEVSPGVDFQMLELVDESEQDRTFDENSATFRLGLGIGFDIGISDLVTIAPVIGYDFSTRPDWAGLPDAVGVVAEEPSGNEWLFHAGIRVMFRPDYRRRYR